MKTEKILRLEVRNQQYIQSVRFGFERLTSIIEVKRFAFGLELIWLTKKKEAPSLASNQKLLIFLGFEPSTFNLYFSLSIQSSELKNNLVSGV